MLRTSLKAGLILWLTSHEIRLLRTYYRVNKSYSIVGFYVLVFCWPAWFVCFLQDNFLRGDSNRRVQQQRRPRKKTKPPALTKKHKKKKRKVVRRPQKPIPPALPQGNLPMPPTLALPTHHASIRYTYPYMQHQHSTFLLNRMVRYSTSHIYFHFHVTCTIIRDTRVI